MKAPDRWTGESIDDLLALEGQVEAYEITYLFDWALGVEKADTRKAGLLVSVLNRLQRSLGMIWDMYDFRRLSRTECIVCTVQGLVRDVNNGGFEQFFLNMSPLVMYAVEACEAISCPETSALTRKALEIVGLPMRPHWKQIHQTLAKYPVEFNYRLLDECDRPFYALEEQHEVNLLSFIKRHRAEISFPLFRPS